MTAGFPWKISVPEGEEIARKTFNPRLGIEGGISILGTSGIVMPMSEEALIASIRAEMSMLSAAGAEYLVITPGNYGETFSRQMHGLDLTCEMKCSNYVGETVDMAEELGVRGILFIAHIGKFIKVSGGIMNTHSRNADSRAELMAAAALRSGADRETAVRILASNTTEEALTCWRSAEENSMIAPWRNLPAREILSGRQMPRFHGNGRDPVFVRPGKAGRDGKRFGADKSYKYSDRKDKEMKAKLYGVASGREIRSC